MRIFVYFIIAVFLYAPRVYAGFPHTLPTGRTVNESLEMATKRANAGDVRMMTALGLAYLTGEQYLPQNYDEGIKWIKMAADKEYPPAEQILGTAYFRGTGVPQDDKEGMKWVQKAADDGDAEACVMLGTIYSEGSVAHVAKDQCKGHSYFEKAAKANNSHGQYFLAFNRLKGVCSQQDKEEAARLLSASAEQKNREAAHALAIWYFNGAGVAKDDAKGVEWLTRAAELDNVESQYTLALIYLQGKKGVTVNRWVALEWLEKAAHL